VRSKFVKKWVQSQACLRLCRALSECAKQIR